MTNTNVKIFNFLILGFLFPILSFAVLPPAPTDIKLLISGNTGNNALVLSWNYDSASVGFSDLQFKVESANVDPYYIGPSTTFTLLKTCSQPLATNCFIADSNTSLGTFRFQTTAAKNLTSQKTFRVKACLGSECSYSDLVGGRTPLPPSNLSNSSNILSAELSWTSNSTSLTDEFAVQFKLGTNPWYTYGYVGKINSVLQTSFTYTPLAPATLYKFRVLAIKWDRGSSGPSNIIEYTPPNLPAIPSNFGATQPIPPTTGSITASIRLSWKDNSNNETGFKIERRSDPNSTFPERIFQVGANVTSNTDTINIGTSYYYRLYSYCAVGNPNSCLPGNPEYTQVLNYGSSTLSNTLNVRIPKAPNTLSGTIINLSLANLNWNANGETAFLIEKASTGAFSQVQNLSNITIGSSTITGLVSKTNHKFRVRSYLPGGFYSAYSNEVSLLSDGPSDLYVYNVSNGNQLSWERQFVNQTGFVVEAAESQNDCATTCTDCIFSPITSLPKNSLDVLDINTVYGNVHYYRVRTDNVSGVNYSNIVCIQTNFYNYTATIYSQGADFACSTRTFVNNPIKNFIYCSGKNSKGQLGSPSLNIQKTGDSWQYVKTADEEILTNPSNIASGAEHSCGIFSGKVYCWGSNDLGQLGDNSYEEKSYARLVQFPNPFINTISLTVGDKTNCVVQDNNKALCWGKNSFGLLGDLTTPEEVPARLGDGSSKKNATPTILNFPGAPIEYTIPSISLGFYAGCAVVAPSAGASANAAGPVYCWGTKKHMGINNLEMKTSGPINICNPAVMSSSVYNDCISAISVSVGINQACFVSASGNSYCWGDNSKGQCGTGVMAANGTVNPNFINIPNRVLGLGNTPVRSVHTGNLFTCFLQGSPPYIKTNQGIQCVGDNTYHQLGDNTEIIGRTTPGPVGDFYNLRSFPKITQFKVPLLGHRPLVQFDLSGMPANPNGEIHWSYWLWGK